MTTKRILIIDDDDGVRDIIQISLEVAGGWEAITACCGSEGLQIARQTPQPDLILLDVMMPDMDGYQVLQHLKDDPSCRDIPVMFVTAANDEQSESYGLKLGAVDYINKPYNPAITRQRIHNQLALRLAQQQVNRFFSLALDLFCILDSCHRLIKINDSWQQGLGYRLTSLEGQDLLTLVHDDDQQATELALQRLQQSNQLSGFVNRLRHRDGQYRHYEWQACSVQATIYATARDITDKLIAEKDMRLMQRVFENSREGIIVTDTDGDIVEVNNGFTSITGYSREEVLGKNPRLLSSGRHDRPFYVTMWQNILEQGFWSGEIWNRNKAGQCFAEWLTISAVNDEHGEPSHFVGIFSDITTLKEYEERLEQIAHYDALTGIPNRVLLADRMQHHLLQNKRDCAMMAVCYLDLDGFKPINDCHGHEAGDRVLLEIAKRITGIIRESDTVARLGGDEFVILLRNLAEQAECESTLQRVLSAIAEPIKVDHSACCVTASIGVALDFGGENDADQLLRRADQAMYQAKQIGKNNYVFYREMN